MTEPTSKGSLVRYYCTAGNGMESFLAQEVKTKLLSEHVCQIPGKVLFSSSAGIHRIRELKSAERLFLLLRQDSPVTIPVHTSPAKAASSLQSRLLRDRGEWSDAVMTWSRLQRELAVSGTPVNTPSTAMGPKRKTNRMWEARRSQKDREGEEESWDGESRKTNREQENEESFLERTKDEEKGIESEEGEGGEGWSRSNAQNKTRISEKKRKRREEDESGVEGRREEKRGGAERRREEERSGRPRESKNKREEEEREGAIGESSVQSNGGTETSNRETKRERGDDDDGDRSSVAEVREPQPSPLGVTQPCPPGVTQASPPGVTQASPPGVTQPCPPGVTQPCPPGVTQASPPGVTQPCPPGVTQASPPGVTQACPPGVTQASLACVSFRVSCRCTGALSRHLSTQELSRVIGSGLSRLLGWRADLKNPQLEINVNLSDDHWILGIPLTRLPLANRSYIKNTGLRSTVAWAMGSLAQIQPGSCVLDPMCGVGTILLEAVQEHKDAHFLGVDIDDGQLQRANENVAFADLRGRIHLLKASCMELPLPSASADAVVCDLPFGRKFDTKTHMAANLPVIITEMERVLRVGGTMVLLLSPQLSCLLKKLQAHPETGPVPTQETEPQTGLQVCPSPLNSSIKQETNQTLPGVKSSSSQGSEPQTGLQPGLPPPLSSLKQEATHRVSLGAIDGVIHKYVKIQT
ncbi:uncharacterized protein thumpd2 [Polymixia lowei]